MQVVGNVVDASSCICLRRNIDFDNSEGKVVDSGRHLVRCLSLESLEDLDLRCSSRNMHAV